MRRLFVLIVALCLAAETVTAVEPGVTSSQESQSMALVPAGEFTMGSAAGDSDEQPEHRVYLDAFLIDKYEVSVGQYAAFLQAKGVEPPTDWKTMNQPAHQKRPAANMDSVDAAGYCKWVNKRLPTEAEWEKAARGTDGRIYPWGNEPPTPRHANFGKRDWNNHGSLEPVGSFEEGKSPYGLYDMAGNVWEWVSDWYDFRYYKSSPSKNPTGPSSGGTKVIRGGAWNGNARALRSANRSVISPTDQGLTGFRCAKNP